MKIYPLDKCYGVLIITKSVWFHAYLSWSCCYKSFFIMCLPVVFLHVFYPIAFLPHSFTVSNVHVSQKLYCAGI